MAASLPFAGSSGHLPATEFLELDLQRNLTRGDASIDCQALAIVHHGRTPPPGGGEMKTKMLEMKTFRTVVTMFCGLQKIMQFEESISAGTQILQCEEKIL